MALVSSVRGNLDFVPLKPLSRGVLFSVILQSEVLLKTKGEER